MRLLLRVCTGMFVLSGLVCLVGPPAARGDVISITPSKDNTLYEKEDGSLSNGAGRYFFAGYTGSEEIRRALINFDIAGNVTPGSTIDSVTLTLRNSSPQTNGTRTVSLHPVLADWGEGVSDAGGQEGGGTSSEPGDATWKHTFYDEDNPDANTWTTLGGDFNPTSSASQTVVDTGDYIWGSTAQMVADVQGWLDNPANNFGWLVKGVESGSNTAKRFNSSENNNASTWPTLTVTFTSPGPTIFNWIGTGGGGSFHEGTNWDAGTAPSSATDIVNLVNNETTDQVATLASSVTVDDLTINGATNTMALGIGQGLAANVGDLQIGSLGGLDVVLVTGNSGHVTASGSATLAGTVTLNTSGPTPALTDTFEFLSFASRTGMFDTLDNHEVVPGQNFSVHYNNTRALAIAGEWAATGQEVTGDVDVPVDLLLSGTWEWNGMLVKWGQGDLTIDLAGGFTAGASAALAIVDGTVLLQGPGQTLTLDQLTYGDLGALSGEPSLQGLYGWYGSPVNVPEPSGMFLMLVGVGVCAVQLNGRRNTARIVRY